MPKPFVYLLVTLGIFLGSSARGSQELRIEGDRFVDRLGRTVLLRGVNAGVEAKLPPFLPFQAPFMGIGLTPGIGEAFGLSSGSSLGATESLPSEPYLSRLRELGFNSIRLLFSWEAYEPRRGQFREDYLDSLLAVADTAWALGLYVVLDFHQDSFSHFVANRCGEGFPSWVVPEFLRRERPRERGTCAATWAIPLMLNPQMHQAWHHFYANTNGVREAFLDLWSRIALRTRTHPGIVAFDLLNEPWGRERAELGPLYEAVAARIRAVDPDSILLVEPGLFLPTVGLKDTRLFRPSFSGLVYGPHFYNPFVIGFRRWSGIYRNFERAAFARMARRARSWAAPLFVGEFGVPGTVRRAGDLMDSQYDELDRWLASSTQWSYVPSWTARRQDGWNHEDFSIVDGDGRLRANYRPRATAQSVGGRLLQQRMQRDRWGQFVRFDATWDDAISGSESTFYSPAPHSWVHAQPRSLRCRPVPSSGQIHCLDSGLSQDQGKLRAVSFGPLQ